MTDRKRSRNISRYITAFIESLKTNGSPEPRFDNLRLVPVGVSQVTGLSHETKKPGGNGGKITSVVTNINGNMFCTAVANVRVQLRKYADNAGEYVEI
jgi:hypothetical protein